MDIIVKLLENKDKEKTVKAGRKEGHITYKGQSQEKRLTSYQKQQRPEMKKGHL